MQDVVVVGRPSERWGSQVVAVAQARDGSSVTDDELLAEAATHVARYQVPKAIVRVDEMGRPPSGKADPRSATAGVAEAGRS
jgi:acyl-CoA synthetase (AMP-forming)/AMP-acid ligase II